jgi:hypothetical protein
MPVLLKAKQTLLQKKTFPESTETDFPEAPETLATENPQESRGRMSPPVFQLPFHICLFEDVPFHKQALFVVWMSTLGPLFLAIRLTLAVIILSIKGPQGIFEP